MTLTPTEILPYRMQQLIDTAANWAANNPIIFPGEIALAVQLDDSLTFRVAKSPDGDHYNDLTDGIQGPAGPTGPMGPGADAIALVAVTTNVASLSGTGTFDGVVVAANKVIVLTAQTTGKNNGPWTVKAGAWTRPSNYPTGLDATGFSVHIEAGTKATSIYAVNGAGPYVVDTDATVWGRIAGSGNPDDTLNGLLLTWSSATHSYADGSSVLAAAVAAAALKANNLSDLADAGTSRGNLHVPVLAPAEVVTATNQTSLSGKPTINGYTLTNDDVILLVGQTTASQNGPWQVPHTGSGAWARPNDFPSGASVRGRSCKVMQDGSDWTLKTTTVLVVDTGSQTWVQSNSAAYEALLSGTIDTATSGTLNVNVPALISASGGNVTRALPSTSTLGAQIVIGKSDSGTNTVTATGKINGVGSSSATCTVQGETITFVGDGGTGWIILSGGLTGAYDTRYQLAGSAVGSLLADLPLATSVSTTIGTSFTDITGTPLTISPTLGTRAVDVEANLCLQPTAAVQVTADIYDVTAGALLGCGMAVSVAAAGIVNIKIRKNLNPGAGARTYKVQLKVSSSTAVAVFGTNNGVCSSLYCIQR